MNFPDNPAASDVLVALLRSARAAHTRLRCTHVIVNA